MRLDYGDLSNSRGEPVVMKGVDDARVELHIRIEDNGNATLLAFAGAGGAVARRMHQGPYETRHQAIAARGAIVQSLLSRGYTVESDEHAVWSMEAQRDIRSARAIKQRSSGDYTFDPKDVFLDW